MKAALNIAVLCLEFAVLLAASVLISFNFYARLFFGAAALLLCICVAASEMDFAYKTLYVFILAIFPCFGVIIYSVMRADGYNSALRRFKKSKTKKYGKTAAYLSSAFGISFQKANDIMYYPEGSDFFAALFKEISSAKKFVFLQFFIVKEGRLQTELFDLLKEKAKQGVEIKFLYDGFGALFFERRLKKYARGYGFSCKCFNPVGWVLRGGISRRHHGKLAVIDGKIGFVGGVNIGDEYVNLTYRFGKWKDGGVSFSGAAVNALSRVFCADYRIDCGKYIGESEAVAQTDEYIGVFTSPPAGGKSMIADMYLTAVYNAKNSVTACTPYLVPDDAVYRALISAASRGVKVKIIIPEIPDKKTIYKVTLAYAAELSAKGVQIYMYKGGFVHSKYTVIDGVYIITGSCNLDFRSMYLHYETGAWIKNGVLAAQIENDICSCVKTFEKKYEIKNVKRGKLLKLFAPLM